MATFPKKMPSASLLRHLVPPKSTQTLSSSSTETSTPIPKRLSIPPSQYKVFHQTIQILKQSSQDQNYIKFLDSLEQSVPKPLSKLTKSPSSIATSPETSASPFTGKLPKGHVRTVEKYERQVRIETKMKEMDTIIKNWKAEKLKAKLAAKPDMPF